MSGEGLTIELMQGAYRKLPVAVSSAIQEVLGVHSELYGMPSNQPHHLSVDLAHRLAALTWIERQSR